MARAFLSVFAAVAIFWVSGCGGGSCTPTGTGSTPDTTCTTTTTVTIILHPSAATSVALGGTLQFTADVSGYSNIALSWEVNGVEGGDSTVGTISTSGLYTAPATVPNPATVTVTAISQANTSNEANVSVVIVSGAAVSVAPPAADLLPGKQQQFTATVTGNSNTNVTWLVAGVAGGNSVVGTITAQGLYSAPASLGTAPQSLTVAATTVVDATKTAVASLTLHNNISVGLSPGSATVKTFAQQQFVASVASDTGATFSWNVNGVPGGNATYGTIGDSVDGSGIHHGIYTAPSHVPTTAVSGTNLATGGTRTTPVTVTAVYQADTYFSASAVTTVTSPNQAVQSLPTPLGVSGGNANDTGAGTCCGGTLGSLVSRGGQHYILSNSHVLARTGLGTVGDSIIQPGLFDASCSAAAANTVGTLSQFVDLEAPPASGPVDAALALVSAGKVDASGTILQLGASTTSEGQPTDGAPHAGSGVPPTLYGPDGVTPLRVAKSGRATGLTCSAISAINVTASVTFQRGCGTGPQFQQTYSDLVVVEGGSFSAQGDSGALIVTQDSADPVALLFASSDAASLGAPVSEVLGALADPGTGETPIFVGSSSAHGVAACSLPGAQSLAGASANPVSSVSADDLELAARIRDQNASVLLAYPGVVSLGVGASLDSPAEPALLVIVNPGTRASALPKQVGGVRLRILEQAGSLPPAGILSVSDSQRIMMAQAEIPSTQVLTAAEVARASAAKTDAVAGLLQLSGIQGVGVTASADSPAEAALLVYVVRGSTHAAIPPVVNGVRTAIRASSLFRSGFGSAAGTACAASRRAQPQAQEKR